MSLPIFINGRFLAQRLAGVQRYATEMSRALLARRPDATILAPPDAQMALGNVRIIGKRTGQAWEQFELPLAARGGILVNLGNTAPIFGRRQLVVIHDAGVFSTPEAYSRLFRLWYKTLHFALSRRGARIVTVSQFSRAELHAHLNIDAVSIDVAGEGADHMARAVADDTVLADHGLTAGKFVLAVGTLAAHKNLSSLAALADRLATEGMILAITGAVGAAAFSGDAALPAAAKYLGRVSDEALKALYANAACYIFPSRYEGFGLPAVEAMACGCAVVAADIPALRETCGDAALYCDPADPAAIAATVMSLLADQGRLAALRQAATEHVADLSWANAAAALDAIIAVLEAA